MPFDADDLHRFTRTDAGLVVAQLSYRAHVTRTAPPWVEKGVSLWGPLSDNPERIMRWTDERIEYAAAHDTLPDVPDSFPKGVNHNDAESFLTVAQLAFRGGLTLARPSASLIETEYGGFRSRGAEFMLRWIDQRMRESIARLQSGQWTFDTGRGSAFAGDVSAPAYPGGRKSDAAPHRLAEEEDDKVIASMNARRVAQGKPPLSDEQEKSVRETRRSRQVL